VAIVLATGAVRMTRAEDGHPWALAARRAMRRPDQKSLK
jgi:hypothetical protein